MKPPVVFIIPYFGKLPAYFNSFVQTVRDKKFDILFFSDIEKPAKLPSNIQWSYYSLEKIKELFEAKLEQTVALKNAYKLCDLKPAYGFLFSEFTEGYRFWGIMDLDICVGDFNKYLGEEVLEALDVYSGIKEYVSGCFFVVRNDDFFNRLFQKSRDWRKVFSNEKYLGFDECGGQYFEQLKQGKTFDEIKPPIESFTEVLLKEEREITRIKFAGNIIEPKQGTTMVNKTSVIYNKKDYLLVHFIYYKSWYFFYTRKRVKPPFYINRLGFFQHKPGVFKLLVSKNVWFAVQQKIKINLKKIQLRA